MSPSNNHTSESTPIMHVHEKHSYYSSNVFITCVLIFFIFVSSILCMHGEKCTEVDRVVWKC